MKTAELLAGYRARNLHRLNDTDPLRAEVGGIGDTYFVLRAIRSSILDISDLRGRWRLVEPMITQKKWADREYFLRGALAVGMHVTESEDPEFEHVRGIRSRIPEFLGTNGTDLVDFLGIDGIAFTTGAAVLTAGIIDLSQPLRYDHRRELGRKIYKSVTENDNVSPIKVIHVTSGLATWLDVR